MANVLHTACYVRELVEDDGQPLLMYAPRGLLLKLDADALLDQGVLVTLYPSECQ